MVSLVHLSRPSPFPPPALVPPPQPQLPAGALEGAQGAVRQAFKRRRCRRRGRRRGQRGRRRLWQRRRHAACEAQPGGPLHLHHPNPWWVGGRERGSRAFNAHGLGPVASAPLQPTHNILINSRELPMPWPGGRHLALASRHRRRGVAGYGGGLPQHVHQARPHTGPRRAGGGGHPPQRKHVHRQSAGAASFCPRVRLGCALECSTAHVCSIAVHRRAALGWVLRSRRLPNR